MPISFGARISWTVLTRSNLTQIHTASRVHNFGSHCKLYSAKFTVWTFQFITQALLIELNPNSKLQTTEFLAMSRPITLLFCFFHKKPSSYDFNVRWSLLKVYGNGLSLKEREYYFQIQSALSRLFSSGYGAYQLALFCYQRLVIYRRRIRQTVWFRRSQKLSTRVWTILGADECSNQFCSWLRNIIFFILNINEY